MTSNALDIPCSARTPDEALADAHRVLPNITTRCAALVARGADPGVLARELVHVLGAIADLTGGAPWTPADIAALAAGLAPVPSPTAPTTPPGRT